MKNDQIKNKIFVFILCLSVVLPSLISENITTTNINSQDIDTQLGTFSIDDPIGGTTFGANAPAHNAPANGLITFDRTVTISWGSVALAMAYGLQVDNNADFSSPLIDVNTGTDLTYTTSTLSNGVYYWRVRAQVLLIWGAWSDPWNFRVNYVAPALVSPSSGTTTFDSTPYLDWNSVLGATTYYLQIDDSSSFSSINYQYSTGGTYYYPSLPNNIWYWRVYARDSQGNAGPYSSYRSLRVDTTPPTLVSPPNGYITNDATPYLDWNSVTGANLYGLQVSANSAFTSIVYSASTTATAVTTPTLSNGIKYWRVRARDTTGYWGPYCSYWTFTIDTIAPSAPALISPANGYVSSDTTPLLDWASVSGCDNYNIQVSTVSNFATLIYNVYTPSTAFTPSTLADDTYYWRVRAQDLANNWGGFSGYRSFAIDTTDPVFNLIYHTPTTPDDDDSVAINCDASDTNGLSALKVYVRVNGGSWNILDMNYVTGSLYTRTIGTFNYADFVEYYIVATDNAAPIANVIVNDNSGSYYSFTIASSDVTAPGIWFVTQSPFTPDDTESITISCDTNDTNGIQSVTLYYRINGGIWNSDVMLYDSGDTFTKNIGIFAYGTLIEYYIESVDDSPNHNVGIEDNSGSYYSFTIISSDNDGPTITDIENDPITPNDVQTVNITCTVIDPNGIEGVTLHYRVDSGAWVNISMTLLSGNVYSAIIGAFNYNEVVEYFISATDDYLLHNLAVEDNSGSYYSFTITSSDLTGPIMSDIGHYPPSPTDLTSVNIGCVVTDSNGIQSVTLYYRINGGDWIFVPMILTSSDTYNFTIGYFAYGTEIEYYITAVDNSPNHNEVTDNNGGLYYSFIIISSDNDGPTITDVRYDPLSPNELDTVNITCNVFDLNGIQEVTLHYRIDSGTWTNVSMILLSGNTYGKIVGAFAYDEFVEFYINATDDYVLHNIAINDNTGLFYSFTIVSSDVIAPEITAISHSPSTANELDMITISCDVTDASGIFAVYLYYRVNGGSWVAQSMSHTSGNTYNRTITSFYYEDFIEYAVRAVDNSPNQNAITDDNGGAYYSFTIVSSDSTNPTINTVTINPTFIYNTDSVNITCYAYVASGLQSVSLYYMVNDDSWIKVDMTLLSGNTYGVLLDPFTAGDSVSFYIEAIDDSVAENVQIEDNGGLNYSFNVEEYTIPSPITYFIPLITMFSLIILIRKRK